MILEGDCIEQMRQMDEASVDAIVTDPPYHLTFMGRTWDHAPSPAESQRQHHAWATEALRVLKPGGHLLAFGGTRTYHRLACAIEDAGFEIRDCLAWLYGSGFPKSLDVSKAIDKVSSCSQCGGTGKVVGHHGVISSCSYCGGSGRGAKREVVGHKKLNPRDTKVYAPKSESEFTTGQIERGLDAQQITAPATPEAAQWEGWGTALKPAHEPIVLARKPLIGTVAQNALEHGTGALNIDGCRIGFQGEADERESKDKNRHADFGSGARENKVYGEDNRARGENGNYDAPGRWPSNVVLDPEAAAMLDEQSGERVGAHADPGRERHEHHGFTDGWRGSGRRQTHDKSGGASRFFATFSNRSDKDVNETSGSWHCFICGAVVPAKDALRHDSQHGASSSETRFRYCAKASRGERNAGLDGFEEKPLETLEGGEFRSTNGGSVRTTTSKNARGRNVHPTVKPIDLMRWLVRLVTPPGGTCLDPFAGSGTTGCACVLEGFDFIGIEREPEYVEIARARIAFWEPHAGRDTEDVLVEAGLSERLQREHQEAGQLGLMDDAS